MFTNRKEREAIQRRKLVEKVCDILEVEFRRFNYPENEKNDLIREAIKKMTRAQGSKKVTLRDISDIYGGL